MRVLYAVIALLFLLNSRGRELFEDFASAPGARGWNVYGEAELFNWDGEGEALQVTWDSSKTNSYFYYNLPFYLTRKDSFGVELNLTLGDIQHGTTPGKPYTFQLAFGFLNTTNAFDPEFFRGSGVNSLHGARNVLEFDYFPDSGFGATVAPTIATEKNQIYFSDNHPLEVTTGDEFHISLNYDSISQTLRTTMTKNGEPFGMPPNNAIAPLVFPNITSDMVLNAFALSSYSDAGQSPPQFSGSILAHGTIDNIRITWPDPPSLLLEVINLGLEISIQFEGQSGWIYSLYETVNFQEWDFLQMAEPGESGTLDFRVPSSAEHRFFRVTAQRVVVR
jgi:hypothetical protein